MLWRDRFYLTFDMKRFQFPFANFFIQFMCLWLWVQIQFFAKELLASLILLQCRAVLACLNINLHQLAMHRFIQRIERDHSPRDREWLYLLGQAHNNLLKA